MTKLETVVETSWNLENSYADLPERFFTKVEPTPVSAPELVILNSSLAEALDLNVVELEEEVEVFAGNKLPEGSTPIAQAYAGHQFGHFTMLGDGRAILLGEQVTSWGERFDIQLKGSGKTPYSRRGDGRATLGPMLREYIISEAMYGLGIPTTRSLAVVKTGEGVMRESQLSGAVLTRVASSHLRVGTFEYISQWGSKEELKILADYAIDRHFPEVKNGENPYISLLQEVIRRQASLIAKWQLVGFIHGVMNTDNMTISGETIDYGPCAFMDVYDRKTVFSSIDRRGRYAYINQPAIGEWNLARFAQTLLPLIDDDQGRALQLARNEVVKFSQLYQSDWLEGMRVKLGIFNEEPGDKTLIEDLLNMMEEYESDYSNIFRALALDDLEGMKLFKREEFNQWYHRWQERLGRQEESKECSQQLMRDSNPALIPRNHRVEEALKAAVEEGDYSVMERLLKVLSNPYAYSSEQEKYTTPPEPSDTPYRTFCGT
ncbi:protein adenylyltransferase SelO [Halonatronum saccharophilum]|uniref:protein adenylyltransferase SelO n=1 Tax=Halonatronum saccharophilum TaxID=150060 RepID=UPI000484E4B1|nr:YdiU family protein [Halonatronum saccharophilum]